MDRVFLDFIWLSIYPQSHGASSRRGNFRIGSESRKNSSKRGQSSKCNPTGELIDKNRYGYR